MHAGYSYDSGEGGGSGSLEVLKASEQCFKIVTVVNTKDYVKFPAPK